MLIQEEILEFHISVHDVAVVQVFDALAHLAFIEATRSVTVRGLEEEALRQGVIGSTIWPLLQEVVQGAATHLT